METYNEGARFQHKAAGGGVAYVRWGHTNCAAGAETVYSGRVGGSHFSHRGGGSNYQCLTLEPENEDFGPGTVSGSFMYGTEYEVYANNPSVDKLLQNHDVPCAVCYVSTRSAKIMIPGTYKCPSSWNEEFHGFLIPTLRARFCLAMAWSVEMTRSDTVHALSRVKWRWAIRVRR
ncbi:hypothetical protein GBAR_LOCUS26556 [Geodia barretti]|uniref:Uncharacterized protein n=1 Tax=Geodia barretti TaxID=519541 RepID=A0AA35THI3_GEOBA|nr:hypothetical protein GBAR_LOCUS26556 [Geodia barretti]